MMCPPSKHPQVTLFEPVTNHDFTRVGTDEPHFSRRKEILKKYPQIKQLYGPDIRLLPAMLAISAAQLALSVFAATRIESLKHFMLLAYSIGGVLTHWLSLGNHELSHNLCFKSTLPNELLGLVANCAQAIPSCISFKRYHLEHHYKQGEHGTDVDVPTELEARFFNNTFKKIFFVFLQPAFYALRPVLVYPKTPTRMEILNNIVVLSFNLALGLKFGIKAPLFNFASTVLGMGLHPVAGHFISEHYTFVEGQETYSYYGPLNWVTFNVGYHNEHHDFPRISGFNLPKVTAIAPEYYNNLHSYNSWPQVLYDFITRPDMSPFSRVKRFSKKQKAEMLAQRKEVDERPRVPLDSSSDESDSDDLRTSSPEAKKSS